ncbi:hypothetical protein I7I53_00308 [Histoplasma capsulatum var. duboisii H88]|uniref:Uncharacterized protein n=1 Tax=Ajellomyces capsulatus (strain H88) TaxID=544711 RepID=A0A8A1LGX6_AJEC8|nr:hypothetical protein I7I53_00308 [Histoplasma capsulatum var. duboisii H88]
MQPSSREDSWWRYLATLEFSCMYMYFVHLESPVQKVTMCCPAHMPSPKCLTDLHRSTSEP